MLERIFHNGLQNKRGYHGLRQVQRIRDAPFHPDAVAKSDMVDRVIFIHDPHLPGEGHLLVVAHEAVPQQMGQCRDEGLGAVGLFCACRLQNDVKGVEKEMRVGLYLVYPQLKEQVLHYIMSGNEIQHTLSAEFTEPIRHSVCAELQTSEIQHNKWSIPSERLFNKLPYSHLKFISKIESPIKRAFYEMEAIRGCWSARELERQIASLYYERSGLSKNKEALSDLVRQQAALLQPKDVINTPVTLEFLGLNERALVTESDLEQSILDNLQHFLLEMGHGFCFEARQKRILIDEDYFFADLVFYHRILKCHVIVELKIDKFRHEYASQLNMYLNHFKAEVMQPDDNPPIGILLCTEKGDTLVKYATAGLDPNIFVQKYMIELPSEEEIKEFITSANCQ